MHTRIRKYRTADFDPDGRPNPDPPVGCRTILQPVFFPCDAWAPVPSDWSPNIVQGKTYGLAHGEGRRMWDACRAHAQALAGAVIGEAPLAAAADAGAPHDHYAADQLIRPRLGQGAFRIAATGEHSLPVLDGAHEITNGLPLWPDAFPSEPRQDLNYGLYSEDGGMIWHRKLNLNWRPDFPRERDQHHRRSPECSRPELYDSISASATQLSTYFWCLR